MERKQQTARKSRMKELYAVCFLIYNARGSPSNAEGKEKKKDEEGGWEGGRTVLAPPRMRRLFSQ